MLFELSYKRIDTAKPRKKIVERVYSERYTFTQVKEYFETLNSLFCETTFNEDESGYTLTCQIGTITVSWIMRVIEN